MRKFKSKFKIKFMVIEYSFFAVLLLLQMTLNSCGKKYTPEQLTYIHGIEKLRQQKDDYMKNAPDSPFQRDKNVKFHPLNYYHIDPDYVFHSKLYEYDKKDTVSVFGTKGEERKIVRYGYVNFNMNNKAYKINIYQGKTGNGTEYYTIWFTDKTTGDETYGVGRYLDFDLSRDKNYIYTIDFNLAYNPYCAYTPMYSCAIPTKDDHIDVAIEAGEKKFH
ncbi:MAG: DUF1684 domain-containing protein [Ignavibacteriaceae bacterium]